MVPIANIDYKFEDSIEQKLMKNLEKRVKVWN